MYSVVTMRRLAHQYACFCLYLSSDGYLHMCMQWSKIKVITIQTHNINGNYFTVLRGLKSVKNLHRKAWCLSATK